MVEQLKVLSVKELNENKINIQLAKSKKLIVDNNCQLYLKVNSLYRKTLEYYINSLLDLKNMMY